MRQQLKRRIQLPLVQACSLYIHIYVYTHSDNVYGAGAIAGVVVVFVEVPFS